MSKINIVLIILFVIILFFLIGSREMFKNFGFKIRYSVYPFIASEEKMDKLNSESKKIAKESGRTVTIIVHGAGASYYKDVYPTAIWLNEKGLNPISYGYDYKADPEMVVKKFSEYVDSVLSETGLEKVNIYAVCLGGILTRYYAQDFGGSAKINKLVTVISPAIPIPESEIAYQFDKYFSFDPEPWNNVLEKIKDKNPVEKHLYLYCKKDILVPSKYQFSQNGKYVGLNCGHTFVNENFEIFNSAHDFIIKE